MPPRSHRPPNRALRARDAGLRKVSVATKVMVVGSVATAGVFASMAAWAQPGRSKGTTSAAPGVPQTLPISSVGSGTTATVPATTPQTAAQDDGGGENLTPPTAAPATVPAQDPNYQYSPPSYQYSPPVVVSGAS